MDEFISEDDLQTFEGWLNYQSVDAATTSPEDLEKWRCLFKEARERTLACTKVGLMKFKPDPGEHRYAVAVQEGSDLWLTLWVKRSRHGVPSSLQAAASHSNRTGRRSVGFGPGNRIACADPQYAT